MRRDSLPRGSVCLGKLDADSLRNGLVQFVGGEVRVQDLRRGAKAVAVSLTCIWIAVLDHELDESRPRAVRAPEQDDLVRLGRTFPALDVTPFLSPQHYVLAIPTNVTARRPLRTAHRTAVPVLRASFTPP